MLDVKTTTHALQDRLAPPPVQDQRQLAESTAQSFEQIFVQQMVQAMRSSSLAGEGEGLFGQGPEAGCYEDWFDLHLSRHLAQNGGIGLASTLLRDWERHGWIEPQGTDRGAVPDEVGDEGGRDVVA